MRLLSRILLTFLIIVVSGLGIVLFMAKPLSPLDNFLKPIPLSNKIPSPPQKIGATSALILMYSGGLKSYYEPCGCQTNMLGGLGRAAAIYAGYLHKHLKPLPIDAGNIYFQNLQVSKNKQQQTKLKAEFIADMMRLMRYRVVGIGAHDLLFGVPYLKKLTKRAKVKALASNLQDNRTKQALFSPHFILEWQGEKLGFFALTDHPNKKNKQRIIPKNFFKSRHLSILPILATAKKEITILRKKGATKIILLSTLGTTALEKLLDEVEGIDIAIEGDEDNEYPPTKRNNKTFVLSTPNEGQKLGILALYSQNKNWDYKEILTISQQKAKINEMKKQIVNYHLQAKKMRAQGAVFAPIAKVYDGQASTLLKEIKQAKKSLSNKLTLSSQSNGYLHFLLPLNGQEHFMATRWLRGYEEKVREANINASKSIKRIPKTEDGNFYVGTKRCAECHKEAYAFWKTMKHSHAYDTLVKKNKQFDQDCIGCHVVGWQEPGGMYDITKPGFHANVQCENCHGYGQLHSLDSHKTSLVVRKITKKVCTKCHTGSHDPHFDFYKKIQIVLGKGHGEAFLKKLRQEGKIK